MPKWFARRMLSAAALAAVSVAAFAQSPQPLPRAVAPMPTPSTPDRQVRVECIVLAVPAAA